MNGSPRSWSARWAKPTRLALGEVDVSADFINFPAQAARRLEGDILPSDLPNEHIMIHKVPYGVTVGIAAWNFPLALACRKIGPALTTGNVMVVKPPSVTPVAVLALGELAQQAGIPPGVLNLVTGGGSTMGEELVTNKITRLVTMTGSTATGQEIFRKAADNLTAVRLELGGKAPFILLEDGDVDKAVEAAVVSRHLNSGQVCTCPERFYIHDAVYDEFLEKYTAAVSKLKIGDPMDEDTDIGPKVNAYETDQLEKIVDQAVEAGRESRAGRQTPRQANEFEKGHWYEPTILTDCTNDMEVMRDEVFGVVSPIMRVGSYEEALASGQRQRLWIGRVPVHSRHAFDPACRVGTRVWRDLRQSSHGRTTSRIPQRAQAQRHRRRRRQVRNGELPGEENDVR